MTMVFSLPYNMKPLKTPRILLAPVEINNNAQRLARGFRRKGVFATAATFKFDDPRSYMSDVNLQLDRTPTKLMRVYKRLFFFLFALGNYDVFHFFYGHTLLPRYADLPILRRAGKKVFMHFRGQDCLNYDIFDYWRAQANNQIADKPPVNTPQQARNIQHLDKYCHEFFVSTPSLEQALPHSTLVPQVVDLNELEYVGAVDRKPEKPIRIYHPTSNPRKFGTDFITEAINELKEKGYELDFQIIQGVPQQQAMKMYTEADIGIDTMLHGWYGNISIEFMALGKPVICFIRDEWRHVKADMPIWDAGPANLVQRLEELIKNSVLRRELGEKGRQFVEQNHDVSVMVDKLLEKYGQCT